MAIPNAEHFLVPALPYLIADKKPTGSKAREMQKAIDKTRQVWTGLYKREALVGSGSQNLPLLAAACGLGITYQQDDDLHQELLDAWLGYASLPWWANEPGTRNVYGSWITTSILVAYSFAKKAGRDDVTSALRNVTRSTAIILALGSGWRKESGKFAGYPVTICGSRSTVTTRPRKDERGRAHQLNFIFGHPLSGLLQGLIETERPKNWEGDVLRACVGRVRVNPLASLRPRERALLAKLIETRSADQVSPDDLETVRQWLEESPLPKAPFDLIRTVEGAATVCRQGINPGSTNPMYAYIWWSKERPASSVLRFYPWAGEDPRVDCLYVDDPGTRSKGRAGLALVDMERRQVMAQRKTSEQFFNDELLEFENGWKPAALPGGEVLWHVHLNKTGVEILSGAINLPAP